MFLVPVFKVLLAAEGFIVQVDGILSGNINFTVLTLHHVFAVDGFCVTGFSGANESPD